MHRISIPRYAQRLLEERGNPRRFLDALDPSRCAFLVVDMQSGFVEPRYRFAIPFAIAIVPTINRLAKAVRSAGGKVVWIRTNFRGEERRWSAWFTHFLQPQVAAEMITCFSPGSPGYELVGDLHTDGRDLQIDKSRFSPFVPGASDLHARLEFDGIDTLIIGGTVTNTMLRDDGTGCNDA